MKTFKYILSLVILFTAFYSCTEEDFGSTQFVSTAIPPTNVSAFFGVTQDNTGLVTITPNAEGAIKYDVYFGDDTTEPVNLKQGENIAHTYSEGTYDVKIVAYGLTGLKTEATKQLVVSFKAPENLEVVITNDEAVSKQVNVTATADYAVTFDVYFGEEGNDEPVSANIGETASYIYQEPGIYTITVVAKGAAIATTEFIQEFEAVAIVQPVTSAPTPPLRNAADVISIYGDAYETLQGINYNPDWGQSGQGSSFAEFDLNGDTMLQYINLSYQGIDFGQEIDASAMEFLHFDVWTADVTDFEVSAIRPGPDERPVSVPLTADQWNSIDIPLSDYTDQGLTLGDLFQLKLVGTPWAAGTVFVDNIYFYKTPSGISTAMVEDFEGTAPTFTVFGNIAATQVVSNPDATGANTTANVAQLTKSAGAETWAGTFFELSGPLDFTNYSKIAVKTWSPKAGAVVKLKLENSDASITHEVDVNTTVANSWEELSYDFSGAPVADYVRIVIFFDFGNTGDDSIYYYDEIQLVSEGGATSLAFQNFEDTAPAFTVFGNIADTQVVSNPDATGINTTANVAQLTKSAGAETWAGTFFELSGPLDFTNYSKIAVKTWSPKAGAVVKLKLENSDASITHEVDMNTTVADSWEELSYDFSGAPVADYVRVVIFFDFGNTGDDTVYYFDEFALTN